MVIHARVLRAYAVRLSWPDGQTQRPRTVSHVLMTDRAVLPEGDSLRVAPAAVAIAAGHITHVSTGVDRQAARDALRPGPDDTVEDLGGALLSPAFIDGHTHLALHALRGLTERRTTDQNVVEDLFYRFESGLTAEEVRAFARVGATEALIHGTGLVFDHYFHGPAVAEAASDVGLCAAIAPTVQDLGGPFAHASEQGLLDTLALDSPAWLARGIAAMVGPHAMDTVSAALWRQIGDVSAARNLPVHVHVAQSLEEVARVSARTGRTPVEELVETHILDVAPTTLAVHMIYASRADLARLTGKHVVLGHCPHSGLIFGHPARLDAWEQACVPWLVGSDCAASNDAMDVRSELRIVLGQAALAATFSSEYGDFLAHANVDAAEGAWDVRRSRRDALARLFEPAALLAGVTSVPGRVHPKLPAGAITPGALANFAVWDADHPVFWPLSDPLRGLALASVSPALLQVMTRGLWRGERGRFADSIVRSEVAIAHRAEASARLRERLVRLGLA